MPKAKSFTPALSHGRAISELARKRGHRTNLGAIICGEAGPGKNRHGCLFCIPQPRATPQNFIIFWK
ncbi:hypothetical protein BGP_0024 [Beggiatoa sp. PS]|nr:hypothetical protein BGP_0024 [Beggiatoa sp. PS]